MWQAFWDYWNSEDGLLQAVILALLAFVMLWLLSILIKRIVVPTWLKWLEKRNHPVLQQLVKGFLTPTIVFLRVAAFCGALLVFAGRIPHDTSIFPSSVLLFILGMPGALTRTLRIAVVLCFAWGLISSSDVSYYLLRNARHHLDIHMGKSVARFLSAVFNVVVIAVAAVILLSEFNYDINGLIAGLGLGGLTIALAAKDSAANFFGGLVLVMEKPFEIGDWVDCSGISGTVEDINLRSTKLRTSAGSLTIVPNATIAAAPITNWSGVMTKRRADFTLSLTYGTPAASIRAFIAAVITLLETDHDVKTESIQVRFAEIGTTSLNIRVIFDTALPGFADHLRIRERLNFAIMDLAKTHGVSFAFPTQTIYTIPVPENDEA